MQTSLADFIKDSQAGEEADRILRSCVHCGFCNATCPTYRLLGDELDGPRGRIYLIKRALEGAEVSAKSLRHLDRCLTCRGCETTCPSGVRYGHLLDIGRQLVERRVGRPWTERLVRWSLRAVLPYRNRVGPLLWLGQALRVLLPASVRSAIPKRRAPGSWPAARHARRMLVLDGCVQPSMGPDINPAAARLLDRLGISLIRARGAGCCGALSHHLTAQQQGLAFARANIDAWWPHLEEGVEALVMTASGCGAMVREYGYLLRHDAAYADRAARVSALTRDLGEVVAAAELPALGHRAERAGRIAYHAPCTLQHGQKLPGVVEGVLRQVGFELAPVAEPGLCCGGAGTYTLLQRGLAGRLLAEKVKALRAGGASEIVTANIGCLLHLQAAAGIPVRHWVELLEETL